MVLLKRRTDRCGVMEAKSGEESTQSATDTP